jgi:catechol 2,3-dioxygenase-like lactoylglutathione lyase family enzyme
LKIDNIMFYVKDLEKAADFYEKVLGLKRAWTDKKAKQIGFLLPGNDSELVIHSDKRIPNPAFSFLVKDVEDFCKEYAKKGHEVHLRPSEVRTGKFAVLKDPEGNEIPIIDLKKFGGKPRYD